MKHHSPLIRKPLPAFSVREIGAIVSMILLPARCFFSFTRSHSSRIAALMIMSQWIIMVPVFGHAEGPVYSIQIGAYQEHEGAVTMVNHLKELGHDAFLREEKINGKVLWYRIYIQKYRSKSEAQKEALAMKKLGLISDYAVKQLPESQQSPVRDNEFKPDVFYLHVSSFKEKTNSEKKVQQLEGLGHRAFHLSEEILGENWHRVYIGEYGSEEEARRIGVDLRAASIISYFKIIKIDKKALSENTPISSKSR